jgi:hypothetical protein
VPDYRYAIEQIHNAGNNLKSGTTIWGRSASYEILNSFFPILCIFDKIIYVMLLSQNINNILA